MTDRDRIEELQATIDSLHYGLEGMPDHLARSVRARIRVLTVRKQAIANRQLRGQGNNR